MKNSIENNTFNKKKTEWETQINVMVFVLNRKWKKILFTLLLRGSSIALAANTNFNYVENDIYVRRKYRFILRTAQVILISKLKTNNNKSANRSIELRVFVNCYRLWFETAIDYEVITQFVQTLNYLLEIEIFSALLLWMKWCNVQQMLSDCSGGKKHQISILVWSVCLLFHSFAKQRLNMLIEQKKKNISQS